MTKEEFDKLKEFAQRLPVIRLQVADGQLLDQCEQALAALVEKVDEYFAAADAMVPAREVLEAPEPEDIKPPVRFEATPHPHYPESEHIEDVPSDIPPHLHRQPGPPPPPPEEWPSAPEVPSEPEREVRHHVAHKTPHKRSTPRKTHR